MQFNIAVALAWLQASRDLFKEKANKPVVIKEGPFLGYPFFPELRKLCLRVSPLFFLIDILFYLLNKYFSQQVELSMFIHIRYHGTRIH